MDVLYGPYGQEFVPGDQYGKIFIDKKNPFILTPASAKSPLTQGLPDDAKTPGGYYKMLDGKNAAELLINLQRFNSRPVPIRFLVLLTLDSTNKLIDCESIAEVKAAKEVCESMVDDPQGKIIFEWSEDKLACDVTINTSGSDSDGIYLSNEQGDVDPTLYVLSDIP